MKTKIEVSIEMTSDYTSNEDFPIIAKEEDESWSYYNIEGIFTKIDEITQEMHINDDETKNLKENIVTFFEKKDYIINPNKITENFVHDTDYLEFIKTEEDEEEEEKKDIYDERSKEKLLFEDLRFNSSEYIEPGFNEQVFCGNEDICIQLIPDVELPDTYDSLIYVHPRIINSRSTEKEVIVFSQLPLLLKIQFQHIEFLYQFFKELCSINENLFYKINGHWLINENSICKNIEWDREHALNDLLNFFENLENKDWDSKQFEYGFLCGYSWSKQRNLLEKVTDSILRIINIKAIQLVKTSTNLMNKINLLERFFKTFLDTGNFQSQRNDFAHIKYEINQISGITEEMEYPKTLEIFESYCNIRKIKDKILKLIRGLVGTFYNQNLDKFVEDYIKTFYNLNDI
jgi:hypothetical protein